MPRVPRVLPTNRHGATPVTVVPVWSHRLVRAFGDIPGFVSGHRVSVDLELFLTEEDGYAWAVRRFREGSGGMDEMDVGMVLESGRLPSLASLSTWLASEWPTFAGEAPIGMRAAADQAYAAARDAHAVHHRSASLLDGG